MKKTQITLFTFFILFVCAMHAQKEKVDYLPTFDDRKLHFGFYLGLNQNDLKIDYKPSTFNNPTISVEASSGFNVGLIADLRLHKNINLRFEPGLISNSRTLAFSHINSAQDSIRTAGSTYLHMPLVLKFSSNRNHNIRPYVLAGISYDHNFSSNEKNPNGNSGGEFRMKSHNFMYELGIGIDIYLNYFKFSPSIRGVFAINNELKYDDEPNSQWTTPIDFLGTRGLFINFAFE
jgi:hypothetical protein